MEQDQETKTMNRDFAKLTEENKKKVVEMTKFMALTQDSIIPALLQSNTQKSTGGIFVYK